ncbi:50S ribosomal protein L21 [Raphidocelis subcapitata]|uniref:50S ribosomal protein L21 n=1 Tax=Raphidocelis subcapitata TaxID=307507 RepID=A0A2V0NTV0_9CHLO|nr:50S ribosomal protein L21 [Raphidocelis subcapitata]|eukprot:GBF90102.1 50S ribosomal protein L21 [Raphidocelis subcapitata]
MQLAQQRASAAVCRRPQAFAGANVPLARSVRPVAPARQQQQQRSFVCQAAAVEAPTAKPSGNPSLLSVGAPDTYAIVEVGGHQMFVEPGKWYTCNRLQVEPGSKIKFGRVLALKQGGTFSVGKPYLEGASVEAEVLEELKAPKVIVYKMRPKKHYRRKNGHRQPLSKFMVTRVG